MGKPTGCFKVFQEVIFKRLFNLLVGIILAVVIFEILCLLSSCVLTCDISYVKKEEEYKVEHEVAKKAERDTILAGMQATGSMAAYSMTGGLAHSGGTPSMYRPPMGSNMAMGPRPMMSRQSMGMGGLARTQSAMNRYPPPMQF